MCITLMNIVYVCVWLFLFVFGCLVVVCVVVGFCLGLITVVTMPAARGGLAIRTADQPQPQLFNV